MRFPSMSPTPELGSRTRLRRTLVAAGIAVLAAGIAVPSALAHGSPAPSPSASGEATLMPSTTRSPKPPQSPTPTTLPSVAPSPSEAPTTTAVPDPTATPAEPTVVGIPKVVGPLASSMKSHPFGAAMFQGVPENLQKKGYVEEEYIISGTANVYDWPAPGPAVVRTADAPYTTRILVRKPVKGAKFSGNVVVEPMNPSNLFDLNIGWAMMNRRAQEV